MLCAICIGVVNFSSLFEMTASAALDESLVEWGYIQSAKDGNIFSNTDKIEFAQTITNKTNSNVYSRVTWDITDETGTFIKSYTRTDLLGAKESKIRSMKIENPRKYGIYTINVTEENCYKTATSNTFTDTYTEEFSICISLDSSNVDQDFGFNQAILGRYGDSEKTPPLLAKAGTKWLRHSIMWAEIEKKEDGGGVYKSLDPYKEKIRKIKEENGIEMVCVLTGRNELYDNNMAPSSPEGIEAYCKYCAYVAKELKGLVDYFEIWNEWNHVNFNPSRETPETYATVLKEAYTKIKKVNPDATVIGCDTAGITPEALAWIERVLIELDKDDEKHMDAISVHCYDYSPTEGFPESQFIGEVDDLKDLLAKYHIDVPIWLTEIGFTTTENYDKGCTYDVQLNSMVFMRAINKAYGLFNKVLQYCFYDNANKTDPTANWGVLNCWKRGYTDKPEADLVPHGAKPAYLGIAAMNYFVGGNCDYIDMSQDGRSYMFEYYNHNLDTNVILAINGGFDNTVTREVQLGCENIDIYDKYGNWTKQMSSPTGDYTIDTYSDPIYIVGRTTNFDVQDSSISIRAFVDLNTNEVTITGRTPEPDDLVSVMVVTKGAELAAYDDGRVEYLTQTVSDGSGNFSVQYTADSLSGKYQIYVNSEKERSRLVEDMEFTYSVPNISVKMNNSAVTGMNQLSAGDRPIIKLTGFDTTGETSPKLIVAQYEENCLKNIKFFSALGAFTSLGNEFIKDFTVVDGADEIKIMFWNMDTYSPLNAFYEIK